MKNDLIARMISGAASQGIFNLASMGLSLFSTVVIARHFSATTFGTFILISVVVNFLSQVTSLGLNLSVAKFVAETEDEERRQRLVNTAIVLRLSAIAVVSLAAWTGRPLLATLFNSSAISDFIIFVPLLYLLENTQGLLKAILQGFFRFSRIGITDLLTSSFNLLLLLTIVPLIKSGVMGLLMARAIAVFLSIIFAYTSIPMRKSLVFHPGIGKELARFGLPLQLNDILHLISSRIDTMIVGALLDPAGIAVYEVARKIPDSLRSLYEPFRSTYFACSSRLFAKGDQGESARLLNDSARLLAFVSLSGTAIALLYGKDIIKLIFSTQYMASTTIFSILMFNLSICLIANVLGTSLVTVGESDKPVIVNIFNATGSILGCIVFIPYWGTIGAAIGTLFGTITVFPATMMFLRKKLDAKILPYLKPLVIFCLWTALVMFLKPVHFLSKACFLALFFLSCAYLSVITRNDLRILLVESGLLSWNPLRRLVPGGS